MGWESYMMLLTYSPRDPVIESAEHTETTKPFEAFQGKTISSIRYKQVDLMEGSVDDTIRLAVLNVSRLINKTHVNTRPGILKHYTLVSE